MNGTKSLNGLAKWIAAGVGLVTVVAAATFQHTRAVDAIKGFRRELARVEKNQEKQAEVLQSVREAVWRLEGRRTAAGGS